MNSHTALTRYAVVGITRLHIITDVEGECIVRLISRDFACSLLEGTINTFDIPQPSRIERRIL